MSTAESFRPVAGRDYPRDFTELVDCRHRGMLFYRLIEGTMATAPHPFERVKAA